MSKVKEWTLAAAFVMLGLLHCTLAVCGHPEASALIDASLWVATRILERE